MKLSALFVVALFAVGCIPHPDEYPLGGKTGETEPEPGGSDPELDDVTPFLPSRVDACDTQGCPSCKVDDDEVCDDGNSLNGDGCNPTCSLETSVTTTFSGLDKPWGVTTDGSTAWIANHGSCTIVSIDLNSGTAERMAGSLDECESRDGRGGEAKFDRPSDLVVVGQFLYVLDYGSGLIRRVDRDSAEVTTLELRHPGKPGDDDDDARVILDKPSGIASDGLSLFVSEREAHRVVEIAIASGAVKTLSDRFEEPMGLATRGDTVWVADKKLNAVFSIAKSDGSTKLLCGSEEQAGARDGIGPEARFEKPVDLALAEDGSLYVSEEEHVLRQIELADARVTTLAGSNGKHGRTDATGAKARFDRPRGIATYGESPSQVVLVADHEAGALRRIE